MATERRRHRQVRGRRRHGQHGQAQRHHDQARHEQAAIAELVAQAPEERTRHQRHQRQRRQVDRLRLDAERIGVDGAEAADGAVAVRVEEQRQRQHQHAAFDPGAAGGVGRGWGRGGVRGVGAVVSSCSCHAMPAIPRLSGVVPTQSHVQLWRYIQKPTLGAMAIAMTDARPQYAIPSARRPPAGRRSCRPPTPTAATTRRCRAPGRAPAAGDSCR